MTVPKLLSQSSGETYAPRTVQIAAHDLLAPLRNVKSLLQFLREDHGPDLPRNAIELLTSADAQIGKARALVNGLVEFADILLQECCLEMASISQLVEESLHSIRTQISDTEAEVLVEGLNGQIACDIDRTKRMLSHILTNALQFRSSKKSMKISIRMAEDNSKLHIQDNGIGFDNKWRQTIFGPFKRLNSTPSGGNGLGLSVCKAVCDLQGWHIEASGKVGEGSRISVSLR